MPKTIMINVKKKKKTLYYIIECGTFCDGGNIKK